MCKKVEKHLKKHKTLYLVLLVVALFAVAVLVLSQTDWFGQMMPDFRGLLIQKK